MLIAITALPQQKVKTTVVDHPDDSDLIPTVVHMLRGKTLLSSVWVLIGVYRWTGRSCQNALGSSKVKKLFMSEDPLIQLFKRFIGLPENTYCRLSEWAEVVSM